MKIEFTPYEHNDRIENGRIVMQGPVKDVLSDASITEHGAVIPEVARFGHEMAKAGKPLSHIPVTISEAEQLVREREGR